jgi:membrane-bound serine protease (ClpP class)
MKRIGLLLIFLAAVLAAFHPAAAQSSEPLVLVMTADGAIFPAMQDYIDRGIKVAEQREAELLVIQLNTPGGSIDTMNQIIESIRSSAVPVVVYMSPRGAWAASAGALVTLAGHAAVMAPETTIGSASPVDSSGSDLDETMKAKITEAMTAKARALTATRGEQATKLAEAMIVDAKSVTAQEALDAHLIDFIANDTNDLLKELDGFTVETSDGSRALHTSNARTEPLNMSFIEQLLLILTDSSIVFLLGTVGLILIWIEISSPGGWVAGFSGVVCLALSAYGLGIFPVNWFGIVFVLTAFVLFILDVKAPTHGALTTAGIVSFIVGALVLFNSPITPPSMRIPVPLVVGVGVAFGVLFFGIMLLALRVRHAPVITGEEVLVGKTGTARTSVDAMGGQVQLLSELWSAESADGSEKIRKGDEVEVVEVKGIRLKVRKK